MARGEGKQRICEAAVRLFNEQGYEQVSLRQIAADAGTTIGNLTYHFARKEDLLEAILADLHGGFSGQLDRSLSGAGLLGHLLELVKSSEENHHRYPFYFENLAQLASSFEAIKARSDEFALGLFGYYTWALAELARDGWLSPEVDGEVAGTLAYALIDLQTSWVQASSPYRNGLLPQIPLSKAVCKLLRAYVREGMRGQYDALCEGIVSR